MTCPVSVIIVTRNEAGRIETCLSFLQNCDDVWVVDSVSRDQTAEIADKAGAKVVPYHWNGQYPKKRQWCLENLPLKYDWVLWVDADEIVPSAVFEEIAEQIAHNPDVAGFFITARYRIKDRILRFGIPNKKIALFHKDRMLFPVVDDLDIPGMGEIEGHYQPVLKAGAEKLKILYLKTPMIHDAFHDIRSWDFRHEKYARWERGMNEKEAWPKDPIIWREAAKRLLRRSYIRPHIMFLIAYIVKLGCLDGKDGFEVARKRYYYLKRINP